MSLTSDDLADIKQLMSSLLSAQEKRLDERFDKIENRLDKMERETDRRFEEQDEKLDEILNAVGGEFLDQSEQISDHERRIRRLENQTA